MPRSRYAQELSIRRIPSEWQLTHETVRPDPSLGEALTKPEETGDSILRSRERIRSADAIQLACATAARTDLFVTNDSRLSGVAIAGITFITGIERVPY